VDPWTDDLPPPPHSVDSLSSSSAVPGSAMPGSLTSAYPTLAAVFTALEVERRGYGGGELAVVKHGSVHSGIDSRAYIAFLLFNTVLPYLVCLVTD
jgi:hypothetical protein